MAILLINPYFMGDTVLLEPVARQLQSATQDDVFILSNYPDLLIGHPVIQASHTKEIENLELSIDFGDVTKSLEEVENKLTWFGKRLRKMFPSLKENPYFSDTYQEIIPEKIKRMYELAGLSESDIIQPKLYLTPEEEQQRELIKGLFHKPMVGIVLGSRHKQKNYPYTKTLITELLKKDYHVFVIGLSYEECPGLIDKQHNLFDLINLPLRTVMTWISALDLVIGPDTAMMHIAGALDVPTTVITREIWADIHAHYPRCDILYAIPDTPFSVKRVPVENVMKSVDNQLGVPDVNFSFSEKRSDDIALFRLDGLGGTLTLVDQAKKIWDMTGIKSTLIIRNYKDIFKDHPYVKEIVEVGYANWNEILRSALESYDVLGEIRFGIGKWHQNGRKVFDQDFTQMQGIFDDFPLNYRELEIHGLHHVLLTDKTMELPYDKLEMDLYNYGDISRFNLPSEYVIIQDGVDIQHAGMRQTKSWDYWNKLVSLIKDVPVIQMGTNHDALVDGVDMDLRSKTSLSELATIVRDAKAVVCTEGGFMHLGYAVKSPNVIVLRGPTRGKLFEYPGQVCLDAYICDNCWSMTGDWYINCPRECDAVCMSSITAGRVAYKIEEILNGNRR